MVGAAATIFPFLTGAAVEVRGIFVTIFQSLKSTATFLSYGDIGDFHLKKANWCDQVFGGCLCVCVQTGSVCVHVQENLCKSHPSDWRVVPEH